MRLRLSFILTAVLILLPGVCFGADESRGMGMVFNYSDGDRPWLSPLPTGVNSTYDEVFERGKCPACYECTGESIDRESSPYGKVPAICMQGRGAKMVVPLRHPTWSHLIFMTLDSGGLCEQEHMLKSYPKHHFDTSRKFHTKYFLVPFNDYEVPTYFAIESREYLPIWKSLFQQLNKISDEYFGNHIHVVGTGLRHNEFDGDSVSYFVVWYYFKVDWVHLILSDCIPIRVKDVVLDRLIDTVEADRYARTIRDGMTHGVRGLEGYMNRIVPIKSILSAEKTRGLISNASALLGFNINRHLKLTSEGHLLLRLFGELDAENNRCIRSTIRLFDGDISEIRETPCYIQ